MVSPMTLMRNEDAVFVYHHRPTNDVAAVTNGLAVIKTSELENILASHPDLQASKKTIKRGARFIEIYQHDLFTEEQREANKDKPNFDANVAGINVPLSQSFRNALSTRSCELVILSTKLTETEEKI